MILNFPKLPRMPLSDHFGAFNVQMKRHAIFQANGSLFVWNGVRKIIHTVISPMDVPA
jgi:hypothetical protein